MTAYSIAVSSIAICVISKSEIFVVFGQYDKNCTEQSYMVQYAKLVDFSHKLNSG